MTDFSVGDVIIVDDDEELLCSFEDSLGMRDIVVRKATDADGCLEHVASRSPDVAVIDIGLENPEKDGIWLLGKLHAAVPDVPVIVLTGHSHLEVGVRAMRLGAFGYVEKPVSNQYLFEVILNAVKLARERRKYRRFFAAKHRKPVSLVGETVAASRMIDHLKQQAEKNCRVMLFGPLGSGKKLCGRFLHERSPRRDQPFVVAECRAGSEQLLEEKLFGKAETDGSHWPGLLEQADGGTIYFDEVCNLPVAIQQKLVLALVRGQFSRVGGGDVPKIDCRVVSGTAKDVNLCVRQGQLRKDLFDRLNVVSIKVPPLDARRDDIPKLCEHFVNEFHRSGTFPHRTFSDESLDLLKSMSWPGNVRQLRNVVERVLLTGESGNKVLVEEIRGQDENPLLTSNDSQTELFWKMTLREARNEFERQYLIAQINRCGGNISTAAKYIGMERSALHRKLKGLDVETKALFGGRSAGPKVTHN